MSWGECKAGAGRFVSLKNDGDKATVVILGEPLVREATDKKGNTRKRVFVNAATADDLDKGEKASILGLNITTAEALSKALKANPEEFKAGESLVGRSTVLITRKGAASDIGTRYLVQVGKKLTPAEVKLANKLELNDLEGVEFKSSN